MRVISLFTGAGGLDLGLHQAGHEVQLMCEADPGAQQVLRKAFQGVQLVPDVCAIPALPLGTELVSAGFPCIDISRAGLRQGLEGQSSGLIKHVFRLLRSAKDQGRPVPWVLLENVDALLNSVRGEPPAVEWIVQQFEDLGYASWAHRVINTAGFGLPNRRRRVFLVASYYADARDVLLSQGAGICRGACLQLFNGRACYQCHDPEGVPSYAVDLGNAQSSPPTDVVPTFKTTNERMCLLLSSNQMGMLRIEDAERLQGLPEGHTEACYPIKSACIGSTVGPLTDQDAEKRESRRFKLIGNAVSVPVARWLGERLREPHRHKYVTGPRDYKLPTHARDHAAAQLGGGSVAEVMGPWHQGLLALTGEEGVADGDYFWVKHDASGHAGHAGAADEPALATPAMDLEQAGSASQMPQIVREAAGRRSQDADAPTAWPRAAWYIKGLGRHGVEDMSEAPILMPLSPLGDFIEKVGAQPKREAVHIWLQRMREQGWDVSDLVRRALACGANIKAEVRGIVRLKGCSRDADSIGQLVWARFPGGVWWPGELLDPFSLPLGRTLPHGAAAALSVADQVSSLPRQQHAAKPDAHMPGSRQSSMDGSDGAGSSSPTPAPRTPQKGAEATKDSKSGPGSSRVESSAGRQTRAQQSANDAQRKVLVICCGSNKCVWVRLHEALPFERHRHEKVSEAQALIDHKKLPQAAAFHRAVKEATNYCELQKGHASDARAADDFASIVASVAATRAAEANLQMDCGRCETCLSTQGAQRRCLVIRAAAAAAAGHSGAQLAVLKEGATGAKIKVWWPLDEDWYAGTITGFDPLRHRHTVHYDDGDVEIIPLWAPNQMVRVVSDPAEWLAEAAKQRQELSHEAAERKQARRQSKRKAEADLAAAAVAEQLPCSNEYEQQRHNNILRNRQKLQSIFSNSAVETAAPDGTASKVEQAAAEAQEPSDEEFFEAQDGLPTAAEAPEEDGLVEVMQACEECKQLSSSLSMHACTSNCGRGFCHEACLPRHLKIKLRRLAASASFNEANLAVPWCCSQCR